MTTQADGSRSLIRFDGSATVTLAFNRPTSRNSIDWSMLDLLHKELADLKANDAVRAVAFAGQGGAFCSGADLKLRSTMSAEERYRHSRSIALALRRISELRMPTLAIIDGPAIGGGCELALACDLRLASRSAVFGLPETKIGSFPGAGGTQRLTRLVGPARAKELILLGETVTADSAYVLGLVNWVVESELLKEKSDAVLATLASRAPLAVRAAKQAIDASGDLHLTAGLDLESALIEPLFATRDYGEGTRAFAERRPPRFEGR